MGNKLSIIVPVYKAEERLKICLESILNQTYENIELILIDDGSPDKSGVICDEYASRDMRVRVLHIDNEGVSNARNIGIESATGDYITFVDSDDTLEEDTYQVAIKHLQETASDMVAYGMVFEYHKGTKILKSQIKKIDDTLILNREDYKRYFWDLYETNYLSSCWNKIFRASIVKENHVKFNKELVVYEDLDFVLRYLTYTNKIVAVSNVFYHYYNTYEKNKLKRRRDTDFKKNIDVLVGSLKTCVVYMDIQDDNELAKINGLIFRYYIIYLERIMLEDISIRKKYNKIKELISNNEFRVYIQNTRYKGRGITLLIHMSKLKIYIGIYIILWLKLRC